MPKTDAPFTTGRRELFLQRESRRACMAIAANGPLYKRQQTGKMQPIHPSALLVFWQEKLAAALFNFKDVVEYVKLQLEDEQVHCEWPSAPYLSIFVTAMTNKITYMPMEGVPMRPPEYYDGMCFELEFKLPMSARKLKQVSPTSLKFLHEASSAVIIAAARVFGVEGNITEFGMSSNNMLQVSLTLGIEEAANPLLPFKTLQALYMGEDSTLPDLEDALYFVENSEDLPLLCGHRPLVSVQSRYSISRMQNNQHGKTEGLGICYTIYL